MPLTRLDNLISSKTGKYLYVSPDDFNATDSLSNRGNSPVTPFKSIQRAFLEIARYSYTPGPSNDRFDQFTVMLMPGIHYIDNRPGIVDTAGIQAFDFSQATNAWGDDPILDISNPDNALYRFNNTEGGAIIPRGSSLVGYDLRRTVVRPLYVPEPASVTYPRSAIFNVTGGCYFWQFTIKDGQTTSESPLYNSSIGSGEVYYDPYDFTKKAVPNFSHHKLTVFEYADKEELQLYYRKVAKAFEKYQPTIVDISPEGIPEFDFNVQENRIVGPLSDSRVIESLKFTDNTTPGVNIPASTTEIEVTTKVDHGYFSGQFVAISGTEIDEEIEGFWSIYSISDDPRKFTYRVPFVVSGIGNGLSSGTAYSVETTPAVGQNAQVLAEVDSVESASPYVFNVSIRSVWGICGIWANGLKATGFKSMVIAQYTGVSLQRDDRAFIRYDEYANTWNQASLVDAFATIPYHAKGDSYWKDEWRNFHVRASEDAFIQNVSIFAVGFADHFLMESGGDMSITNSNSNFGNTSLHAIGFKGFSFNQDKAGYITDIIPPEQVIESETNREKVLYYTIDVAGTIQDSANKTKLFLGGTDLDNPLSRPAATIGGFRVGAKSDDKLYVKLDQKNNIDTFEATLEPTGFVKYIAKGSILNPTGDNEFSIDNNNVDAAGLIESNRRMIQEEVFGYILEKYPRLQNISYVNPALNPAANRYFDAKNLIQNNRQEIVDTAFDQMVEAYGLNNIQGVADGKCKRDIGLIVDAISEDLRDGGNRNIIESTKLYFDGNGDPITNGLVGEEAQSLFAFNKAKNLCKKAIANLLTVKATIYDPDPNSIFAPYGIVAGSTGSAALGLNSEGVSVDDANKQDPASRYRDARNRIIANREFILDAAIAEIPVYHPDFVIPGMDANHATTRYADAYKSIRRNSKEIRDRALATITVSHPDFYFPGDNQTDSGSRYADAYRLIQQNRTEIVESAWANMIVQYPGVASTETKCKRDIGIFVDSVSLDAYINGNEYSYKFAAEYFDNSGNPIVNGLVGETAESIFAFNEARDQMKLAVANQLTITDLTVTEGPAQYNGGGGDISRTNVGACADVQATLDTLTGIITTIISDGNLNSVPTELNKGTGGPGETKCSRDIGYFIDAIAVDVFTGSNKHTRTFIQQYFDGNTPISDGLVNEESESITAFTAAANFMNQAIANQLYDKDLTVTADPATGDNQDPASCANVQSQVTTLATYVTDAITAGNLNSLPAETGNDFIAAEIKCRRDIGHIVDAVAQDLWFGGNEYTIEATKLYFDSNGLIANGVDNEVDPSITAFRRAQDLMNRAVNNQYYYRDLNITLDAIGDPPVFSDIHSNASISILDNKEFIAAEAYERMLAAYPGYTPQSGNTKQDCLDDVYNVLDDIAYNVKFGGNEKTYDAANIYVTNIYEGDDPTTYTPTNVAYNPATGIAVVTINSHTMDVGQYIKFADESIVFTCATNPSIPTAYPRPGDGNYGQFMQITAKTINSVTVNVGISTDTSAHTFVSATTDAVIYGTAQQTFIDAERDEAAKVFTEAKNIALQVINNETTSVSAGNTETQVFDYTITDDWDDDSAPLPQCGSAIAATDTLFGIIIQAIGTDSGVGNLSGVTRTVTPQPTTYTTGNCSDVLTTIDALTSIVTDSLYAGNLNDLPDISNGNWDCANVRSTIDNLFDIFTDAISSGSLGQLPVVNRGDFIINAEASKCFRDVSYIVDAIANDLKYGGNINSVQAGEAYYVGNQLEYIDGEKTETLDAWNYVGSMAIAAMRNFDFLAFNCVTTNSTALVSIATPTGGTRNVPAAALLDVNDTAGILIGMKLVEYSLSDFTNGLLNSGSTPIYNNIPEGTYVKSIVDASTIELGVAGSRQETGNNVNALQISSSTNLYFTFEKGSWADTLPQTVTVGPESSDPDVIQDTTVSPSQRECASTATAIIQLTENITTIINTGLTKIVNGVIVPTVDRAEPTFNTALLASRATVFTIDTTGYGSPNAHDFETGTPVRLVPRPRFDVNTGQYVEVDKRLVRLPNGFETNETYYVIAPGRSTQPVDYSGTTYFNGSDQTKLMLATSKENAAAGIYIYASETAVIDPDVEIDIYQFIVDDKYDLITYTCDLTTAYVGGIETDIAHVFDRPSTSTTPQKVFFRAIEGSDLPDLSTTYASNPAIAITTGINAGKINPNVEFYVRYQTSKVFTIHESLADAQNNVNPIEFNNANGRFRVLSNKKRSPMRFDPTFDGDDTDNGKWYLQCKDRITGESDQTLINGQIFYRIHEADYKSKPTTTDTWYERVGDTREADERTYKLRYVIPKYLENARDPINGFAIKTRTDDTRRLVPQKLLLKPVAGNVYGARFENPQQPGEYIGFTRGELDADDTLKLEDSYDPFRRPLTGEDQDIDYRAIARFTSGVSSTIQSGRYVKDELDDTIQYLELTVFDHGIDTKNFPGLRNEILTSVKITAPQGGSFVTNKTQSVSTSAISFTGNSSGTAYIHGYFNVGGDHYLIIKGISGAKGVSSLEYSEFQGTRFTQGSVFADMLEDQDMGKSLPLKTHIKKKFPEYYYKQNGANVYTITPGDRIQDSTGIEYYVEYVEDTGVIEDTFYVFNSQELQKRIAGQQDGIYYLTCLRGNISPFPQGAGVSTNFQKFKFSQPVGKLYPLNYRNDPLWFTKNGTTNEEKNYYSQLIDPPKAFSAADNYIHGKVTINDTKNSVTRELMGDLSMQPAFIENDYTNTTSDSAGNVIDNRIRAQAGNATSGSEDRRIPIAGDSTVLTDQRYYVELRRPSIARAGNHTFEYLGFGPGNYSTGLPARQEIVLTPDEDFYAQSKKQDAGIVFYTGINSQGDLYIGNRRINAITGEETFIDRATLEDDGDEDDVVDQLVTTFDTPVTFNQNITIVGGPDGELVNNVNSPVLINVPDRQLKNLNAPLVVYSLVSQTDPVTGLPQDLLLDRESFFPNTTGDIRIGKNRVDAAIFGFNPRGEGQGYKIQTHAPGGIASNITPNQDSLVIDGGSRLAATQYVTYTNVIPTTGDILLKGSAINKNGSLGWIFANIYNTIPNNIISSLEVIVDQGVNVGKFTFIDSNSNPVTIGSLNIKSSSEIRLQNINYNGLLNGTWKVLSTPTYPYDPTDNVVYFQINPRTGTPIGAFNATWDSEIVNGGTNPSNNAIISFSVSNWKETAIIGGEALRTETETYGQFKLGINTIARATHDAYLDGFVEPLNTDPRANLDVVGNAYISGRSMTDWLAEDEYNDRERNRISDALVVGWNDGSAENSDDIDAVTAALRVSTETSAITESSRGNNENKVGINVNNSELDRALVVKGDSRFTEDARFERDIEVNGDGTIGEIRTDITTGTFGIVDESTFTGTFNIANSANTANIANGAETVRFADVTTNAQTINIGNNSSTNTMYIGNNVTGDQFFYVGNASNHSNFYIGNVPDSATVATDGSVATPGSGISKVSIGGAFGNTNEDLSYVRVHTQSFRVDGDQWLGFRRPGGTANLRSQASFINFFSNSGGPSTINFGLNASEVNIAGQGGTTTINNSLYVVASAKFDGNILLCGGLASFAFEGVRGQLGTAFTGHDDGVEPDGTFTKNVDILNVLVLDPTDDGYNAVDTAGSGQWGGNAYQQAVTNIGGIPEVEPQELAILTGDEYYLPIKNKPTLANGDPYLSTNDYIIINASVSASGHPEFLQILEVMRANIGPYYLRVKRQPFGAFGAILSNHPDTTPIYKVNVQFDATWFEQSIPASSAAGSLSNFYLAEFGGTLTTNDYIIASRDDSTGTFEYVKVQTPLSEEVQKFRINNGEDCSDVGGDVFVVNSVTGDTNIAGNLTINNTIKLDGGCGTIKQVAFSATATSRTKILTNVVVTSTDDTISDILPGDVIKVTTNESIIEVITDTIVEAVDTVNNTIHISIPLAGASTATIAFTANRNEKLTLTNGSEVPTFEVDTCTGTTHIGTQFGRIEVEYAEAGTASSNITNDASIATSFDNGEFTYAYGYWFDPQIVADGGPSTTVDGTVTGSSNNIQIPVGTLGVGDGKFVAGDLVFVGTPTAASTGKGTFIIGKINETVEDAAGKTIVIETPDSGITTNEPFNTPGDDVYASGNVVRRVIKHKEFARVIDVDRRTRTQSGAQSDYTSVILDKGYVVQQKLDYLGWLAFTNEQHQAVAWAVVSGRLKGVAHKAIMNEQRGDGAIEYRTGSLNLANDLNMIGGNFEIYDSVNQTRLFGFVNDDGHADHQGLLVWDAGVVARGDFFLFSGKDPENVITNPDVNIPTFKVDNDGNVSAQTTFTVIGEAAAVPNAATKQLSVQNLGPNGSEEFVVKKDSSIDSFGYTNFYSSSGGRHTRYLSSASPEEDLTLSPNIAYLVNTTASSTLILTLPTSPQTGDTVRVVDVGGQLSYNTSLVLRTAESSGTKIQGDATGTLLGDRLTPYPSGELVVQTPNAAFTLVYLGGTDNNGQVGIPTAVQGWWLMEV